MSEEKRNEPPDGGFEEMMRQLRDAFGGSGPLFMGAPGASRSPSPASAEDAEPDSRKSALSQVEEFSLTPKDIKAHLDRFVIGQDEAKKALAIAVCDHYHHARHFHEVAKVDEARARAVEFAKQNVLITGPTGVGKTYLVKHVAELVGVPFVKADATKFSETGYVGGDVDDLVRELVRRADGDIDLAEHGIIYIDEIDKLASRAGAGGVRDVSGRGVQTTLLKLMEETEVAARNPMDMASQMSALMEMQRGGGPARQNINTRHILFIVSGAFTGLEKVVSERMRRGAIGFGAAVREVPEGAESLRQAETQDFIEFGFEAEFIGRLPVRVVCDPLEVDDLYRILRESEGSLLRQYEREFEAYGLRVRFSEFGMRRIAELAAKEQTGARGLIGICERLFRPFKFELPGSGATELVVDERFFADPDGVLNDCLKEANREQARQALSSLGGFSRDFREKTGIELVFPVETALALSDAATARTLTVLQFCRHVFRDFEYALPLAARQSSEKKFTVPPEAVSDTSGWLSRVVAEACRTEVSAKATGSGEPVREDALEGGATEDAGKRKEEEA